MERKRRLSASTIIAVTALINFILSYYEVVDYSHKLCVIVVISKAM